MTAMRLGTIASLLLAGLMASPSGAQPLPAEILPKEYPQPDVPPILKFEGLVTKLGAGQVQLVNGDEIDPSMWPALVIAQQSPTTFCSATLVGPRVLLTAAHCVDARNAANKAATVGVVVTLPAGRFVATACEMHEDYAKAQIPVRRADPRSSADYALCELNDEVRDTLFESLADAATQAGDSVLMTGYGCAAIWVSANAIEFGPNDKALRMGLGTIDNAATRDAHGSPGSYLRSAAAGTSPILCSGDSGGPLIIGTTLSDPTPTLRRIAGVNSKVSALPDDGPPRFFSFMAPTATSSFTAFLTTWQHRPGAVDRAVCGADIVPGERNCRGGE